VGTRSLIRSLLNARRKIDFQLSLLICIRTSLKCRSHNWEISQICH
jgi:hypothetical protein